MKLTLSSFLNLHKSNYFRASLSSFIIRLLISGFPGGAVVGSPPANEGDTGSSPGLGGSHMPRSSWACVPQLLSLHSGALHGARALQWEGPPR